MNFLYPCDPFEPKLVDEAFRDEYTCLNESGHNCHLFSTEDLESGLFIVKPVLIEGEAIIYRGWMMTLEEFTIFSDKINGKGAMLLTSVSQYKGCHYLPEWYPVCKKYTPQTVFASQDSDFDVLVSDLAWSGFFIKDYVKSLTTGRGSIAYTASEIREVIKLMEKYRGKVEGGVCIRELEALNLETEERYFVYEGVPYSRNEVLPEIVIEISKIIDSPFFSIDIVMDTNENARLIELGDGQVSDIKKWDVNKFVQIFND